jgi:hypothetical protein
MPLNYMLLLFEARLEMSVFKQETLVGIEAPISCVTFVLLPGENHV